MMSCYDIHTIDNIITVIYVCFSSIDTTPTEATEQASTPKNNRTVAIAAGVAVPVVVLASAFVAFFLFRRHKNKKQHSRFDVYEVDASMVDASKAGTCHEVSDKRQIAAEMPNPDPQELDGESRGT
ncbi:unnamed protein product [Alternaria alternata]